jgi:hypothetical protein
MSSENERNLPNAPEDLFKNKKIPHEIRGVI